MAALPILAVLAAAGLTLLHALAAVHPAIVVAVGAAAVAMALMLAGLRLAVPGLAVLIVLPGLGRGMLLVLGRRRGLRGGGGGDNERDRANQILHDRSPGFELWSKTQERRGGGGSASG